MAAREAARLFCNELGISDAEFTTMQASRVEMIDDNHMLVPKFVKKKWHDFARKEHPDRDGKTFTAMNERYDVFKAWFAEHKQRGVAAEAAADTMRGEKRYGEAMASATEAIGAYCIICDTYVTEQKSKTGSLRINAEKHMQRAKKLLAAIQKEEEELLTVIRKEAEERESQRLQKQEHTDLALGLRGLMQSVLGRASLECAIPQQFDELRTRLDGREQEYKFQIAKLECEAHQMLGEMNDMTTQLCKIETQQECKKLQTSLQQCSNQAIHMQAKMKMQQDEAVHMRTCLTKREQEHKDLEDNVRKRDDMNRQLRATLHITEQDYNEGQELLQQSSIKVTQLRANLQLQQDEATTHFTECEQQHRAQIAGLEGDMRNMLEENKKMMQQSLSKVRQLQDENTDLKTRQQEATGFFNWLQKNMMNAGCSKISNLKESILDLKGENTQLQEHIKEMEIKLHEEQRMLAEEHVRTVHLEESLKEVELNLKGAKQKLAQMESDFDEDFHVAVNMKEIESAAQIEQLHESHKIEVSELKSLLAQQEKEFNNNHVVQAIQRLDEKLKGLVKLLQVAGQKVLELTGEAHQLVLGMLSTLQLESQRAKLFVTHYATAYQETLQNDQELHREV